MDKTELETLRRGFFPLRISIDDKRGGLATELLMRFINETKQKYDLQIIALNHPNNTPHHAEAIVAISFPHKESVRVDFNVFTCIIEDECGDAFRYNFFMESAY